MLQILSQRYADHIDQIEQLIAKEVTYWDWGGEPQMEALVSRYLHRSGKRLRPLLVLLFADLHDGALETAYWPAAAIEVYHTATLIYDDIQDNSEFRRGQPCAHVTASTSTAMNLAAVVRTLMYHFLHRSPHLSTTQKLEIHQLLDHTATLVALGQSIDIGWHEGWYSSYQDFPYERMIMWKSAVLFGCAAAIGTLLSGVDAPVVQLSADGKAKMTQDILQRLRERDMQNMNWQWLVDLMLESKIDCYLRKQFQEKVSELTSAIELIGGNTEVRQGLCLFIASLIQPIGPI